MARRRFKLINAGASASGGTAIELTDLSDVSSSTPTARNVLVADGVDWASRALTLADISDYTGGDFLTEVLEDLSPQLGGDLDLNSWDITGVGNITITGDVTLTLGDVTLDNEQAVNWDTIEFLTVNEGFGGVPATGKLIYLYQTGSDGFDTAISVDGGKTWGAEFNGPPGTSAQDMHLTYSLQDDRWLAMGNATATAMGSESYDGGLTWTLVTPTGTFLGSPGNPTIPNYLHYIEELGMYWSGSPSDAGYRSYDGTAWVKATTAGDNVNYSPAWLVYGNGILTWQLTGTGGMHWSDDEGDTWTLCTGLPGFQASSQQVFCSGFNGGLGQFLAISSGNTYVSDDGKTWVQQGAAANAISGASTAYLAAINTVVTAGGASSLNAYSTDEGVTWTAATTVPAGRTVQEVIADPAHGTFVTTPTSGGGNAFYSSYSEDGGVTWVEVLLASDFGINTAQGLAYGGSFGIMGTKTFVIGDPAVYTVIEGVSTNITSDETDIDGTLNVDGASTFTTGTFTDLTVSGTLNITGDIDAANLNIANWNTAYGWGDHSIAGYPTAYSPFSIIAPWTFEVDPIIRGTGAGIWFQELAATADEGWWQILADNDTFSLLAWDDALTTSTAAFTVNRTAAVVDNIALPTGVGINWDTVELLNFEPVAETGDPYWASVAVLARLDGYDGQSTGYSTQDSTAFNTSFISSASFSNEQVPFTSLTTSLKLDGSAMYMVISNSSNVFLAGSDFTVEGWGYYTADPTTGGGACLMSVYSPSPNREWIFSHRASGKLEFIVSATGSTNIPVISETFVPTLNQWYHLRVTRSGNSWRLFIDGVQLGSTATNSTTIHSGTGGVQIGSFVGGFERWAGYISNARITIGVARSIANFTPPTDSFPVVLGEAAIPESLYVGDPAYPTIIDGLTTNITSAATDIDGTLNVDGAAVFQTTLNAIGVSNLLGGSISGDPGTEGSSVLVNDVAYSTSSKVSDIGGTNAAQFLLHRHSTTLPSVILGVRSKTDDNTHAVMADNDVLMTILAAGWDGVTTYSLSSEIRFEVDGTPGNNDMPGQITFMTAADGTQTPLERMRIRSTGDVEIDNALDITGALTALSYGGITEANLLDKVADETVTGVWSFTGNRVNITGANASLWFEETDTTADNKKWRIINNGGSHQLWLYNDAESVATVAYDVQRTGTVVDSFNIQAPLTATSLNLTGVMSVSEDDARVRLIDTDATADEGIWELRGQSNKLYLRALNDAKSVEGVIFDVDRTGATIDLMTVRPDVIMNNTLKLKERAAAVTDTAAHGQFWVKNDSDMTPCFTDDSGTDRALLEGSAQRGVIRSVMLFITPGTTPGTNFDIVTSDTSGRSYNSESSGITNATDLSSGGTSGSFTANTNSRTITMALPSTCLAVLNSQVIISDANNSTIPHLKVDAFVTSGDIQWSLYNGITTQNHATMMQTGDLIWLRIVYVSIN